MAADRAIQEATVEAQALSSLVSTTDRAALDLSVRQVDATSRFDITVFLADGTRLGAPADRSALVELAGRGTSASADAPGGREIVFAVRDGTGANGVIRTLVPGAELDRGVARAWLLLAGLGVGLLALSLAVADRLARSLVRATIRLADVSHRLARGELTARADPAAPGELGVVATALNHLAGRIADLLREERETIADLSHRVRTPLTVLRLEAEALPAADDAARVGSAVDALQRAVNQVIEQARLRADGADGAGEGAGSDAAAVVADRVEFWSVLAEDTGRELRRAIAVGPLPVAVSRRRVGGLHRRAARQRVRTYPRRHGVRRDAGTSSRRRCAAGGGRRRRRPAGLGADRCAAPWGQQRRVERTRAGHRAPHRRAQRRNAAVGPVGARRAAGERRARAAEQPGERGLAER